MFVVVVSAESSEKEPFKEINVEAMYNALMVENTVLELSYHTSRTSNSYKF